MLKKLLLFILVATISMGSIHEVQAQDDSDYVMWEMIYLTPDYSKLKELGESMAKHNKKYHSEGPYTANVYNVSSGPNSGKLVWQMGPLTFSHLDGRPSADGHDEDWRDNVMVHIKKISTIEYWKQDLELSNTGMFKPGEFSHPILHIRFHEVADGEGHQVKHLLEQALAAKKAQEGVNPFGVYYNQFRQGSKIGRHLATVWFSKNWAQYDDEPTFKKAFKKVHGDDSWQNFIDGLDDAFSNEWDEIWEYNATLSGR